MSSLPLFANNNLTQIFFALLPDKNSNQNIGKREKLPEIQDLLKFGVDVNAEIRPDYTPLCKVIEHGGSKALVELLIYFGAKVDSQGLGFEWTDVDGTVISNQLYALARQRYLKSQDKESLDIQQLIQKQLIQKHLSLSTGMGILEETQTQRLDEGNANISHIGSQPINLNEITLKKKLYVFSFDNTLVNGHFHNILKDMGVAHGRASPDLVEFLLEKYGIKNKTVLLEVFQNILKNGDCISIATATRYPETVFAALIALGLTDDEIDQIFYTCPVLDSAPDLTLGKNLDILKAMVHFDVIDINAVFLIDFEATYLNIAKAKLNVPESNLILVEIGQNPSVAYLQRIQNAFVRKQREIETIENVQKSPAILVNSPENTAVLESLYEYETEPKTIQESLSVKPSIKTSTAAYMPYINFESIQVQVRATGS